MISYSSGNKSIFNNLAISFIILLFVSIPLYQAQGEEGDLIWANRYEFSETDVYSIARCIKETTDGGYAFCENKYYTEDNTLKVYLVLVKVDAEGDTVWTRSYYRGDENYWDWVFSMAITSDGGYVITGVREIYNTTTQIFLLRTDPSGDSLDAQIISDSYSNAYVAYSIQCTDDDGFILAGYNWPLAGYCVEGLYIKLDSQGNREWTQKLPGDTSEGSEYAFFDIYPAEDGGYIMAGVKNFVTYYSIDSSQAVLVKTDSEGNIEWISTMEVSTLFYSVKHLANGEYICAGEMNHLQSDTRAWLVKFDSEGTLLWERSYVHPDHDSNVGLVVSPVGEEGYLIGCTGTFTDSNMNTLNTPMLIKTDNDGDLIDIYEYRDQMLGGSVAINGMEITSDNYYIICGWTDKNLDSNQNPVSINCDSYVMKVKGATVDIDDQNALPQEFSLLQNYPNPFNVTTSIQFMLKDNSDVTLSVYDVLGRKISTLYNGNLSAGTHSVIWNGTNDSGEAVSSGVYFYRLDTSNDSQSKQMILLK